MTEGFNKYELLALFPLTATEDELKAAATKVEERLRSLGATFNGNQILQKGRLAYPVANHRQGYYHLIQFELEPKALRDLQRALTLSGEMLRFTIERKDSFKSFVATAPKAAPSRSWPPRRPATSPPVAPPPPSTSKPTAALTQQPAQPAEAPKVTMEEIDKRLEEILGEGNS